MWRTLDGLPMPWAAAAISELPCHSATLLATDGRAIMTGCYKHEVPQPEPDVEPEEITEEPEE